MKKLLYFLLACFLFTSACDTQSNQAVEEISPDKVYFFYSETCPHCHAAEAYLKKNYPNLPIERVDVSQKDGYALFVKCAEKFNLGNQIGTPLFCINENYMMGWIPEYAPRLDAYLKPFIQ